MHVEAAGIEGLLVMGEQITGRALQRLIQQGEIGSAHGGLKPGAGRLWMRNWTAPLGVADTDSTGSAAEEVNWSLT